MIGLPTHKRTPQEMSDITVSFVIDSESAGNTAPLHEMPSQLHSGQRNTQSIAARTTPFSIPKTHRAIHPSSAEEGTGAPEPFVMAEDATPAKTGLFGVPGNTSARRESGIAYSKLPITSIQVTAP